MLHEDPLLRIFDVQVLTRMSKPGLSMLVPPGPFAPRISYGLRPFAEWNGIVVCAVAHGVIPAKRKSRLLGNTVFAPPFVMLDVQ